MFSRISNSEMSKEELSMKDMKGICLEMAYHDPKTKRRNGKLKSKYVNKLSKIMEKIDEATLSGSEENMEKLYNKLDKVMQRYSSLNPKMSIRVEQSRGKENIIFDEQEVASKIPEFRKIYAIAKQNNRERLQEIKENKVYDKKEKDLAGKLDAREAAEREKQLDRTRSENFVKSLDDIAQGVENRKRMGDYLRGNLADIEESGKFYTSKEDTAKYDKAREALKEYERDNK